MDEQSNDRPPDDASCQQLFRELSEVIRSRPPNDRKFIKKKLMMKPILEIPKHSMTDHCGDLAIVDFTLVQAAYRHFLTSNSDSAKSVSQHVTTNYWKDCYYVAKELECTSNESESEAFKAMVDLQMSEISNDISDPEVLEFCTKEFSNKSFSYALCSVPEDFLASPFSLNNNLDERGDVNDLKLPTEDLSNENTKSTSENLAEKDKIPCKNSKSLRNSKRNKGELNVSSKQGRPIRSSTEICSDNRITVPEPHHHEPMVFNPFDGEHISSKLTISSSVLENTKDGGVYKSPSSNKTDSSGTLLSECLNDLESKLVNDTTVPSSTQVSKQRCNKTPKIKNLGAGLPVKNSAPKVKEKKMTSKDKCIKDRTKRRLNKQTKLSSDDSRALLAETNQLVKKESDSLTSEVPKHSCKSVPLLNLSDTPGESSITSRIKDCCQQLNKNLKVANTDENESASNNADSSLPNKSVKCVSPSVIESCAVESMVTCKENLGVESDNYQESDFNQDENIEMEEGKVNCTNLLKSAYEAESSCISPDIDSLEDKQLQDESFVTNQDGKDSPIPNHECVTNSLAGSSTAKLSCNDSNLLSEILDYELDDLELGDAGALYVDKSAYAQNNSSNDKELQATEDSESFTKDDDETASKRSNEESISPTSEPSEAASASNSEASFPLNEKMISVDVAKDVDMRQNYSYFSNDVCTSPKGPAVFSDDESNSDSEQSFKRRANNSPHFQNWNSVSEPFLSPNYFNLHMKPDISLTLTKESHEAEHQQKEDEMDVELSKQSTDSSLEADGKVLAASSTQELLRRKTHFSRESESSNEFTINHEYDCSKVPNQYSRTVTECTQLIKYKCESNNISEAVCIASEYLAISADLPTKIKIIEELFMGIKDSINLTNNVPEEVLEKAINLLKSSKMPERWLRSLIIAEYFQHPLLVRFSIDLCTFFQENNISINNKAVQAYTNHVISLNALSYILVKFLVYVKRVCNLNLPKALLCQLLERVPKGKDSCLLPEFVQLCDLLCLLNIHEFEKEPLEKFIKVCIKNDCWFQISSFFRAWSTKGYLSDVLLNVLLASLKDAAIFFKKFAAAVYDNGDPEPAFTVLFGCFGIALALRCYVEGQAEEEIINVFNINGFEIFCTLQKYGINCYELLECVFTSEFAKRYFCDLLDKTTVFVLPFELLLNVMETSLAIDRPKDAFDVAKSFTGYLQKFSGILDEEIRSRIKLKLLKNYMQLVFALYRTDPLDCGIKSFHNFVLFLEQSDILKDIDFYKQECRDVTFADIASIFNEYLVSSMNKKLNNNVFELYRHIDSPCKDLLNIKPQVLRGVVVFLAKNQKMYEANLLFKVGCNESIYKVVKNVTTDHFPWKITVKSYWTSQELRFVIERFLKSLFPVLRSKKKSIDFDNWFRVTIMFEESHCTPSNINCLIEHFVQNETVLKRTCKILKSIDPGFTWTEHENFIIISHNSVYNYYTKNYAIMNKEKLQVSSDEKLAFGKTKNAFGENDASACSDMKSSEVSPGGYSKEYGMQMSEEVTSTTSDHFNKRRISSSSAGSSSHDNASPARDNIIKTQEAVLVSSLSHSGTKQPSLSKSPKFKNEQQPVNNGPFQAGQQFRSATINMNAFGCPKLTSPKSNRSAPVTPASDTWMSQHGLSPRNTDDSSTGKASICPWLPESPYHKFSTTPPLNEEFQSPSHFQNRTFPSPIEQPGEFSTPFNHQGRTFQSPKYQPQSPKRQSQEFSPSSNQERGIFQSPKQQSQISSPSKIQNRISRSPKRQSQEFSSPSNIHRRISLSPKQQYKKFQSPPNHREEPYQSPKQAFKHNSPGRSYSNLLANSFTNEPGTSRSPQKIHLANASPGKGGYRNAVYNVNELNRVKKFELGSSRSSLVNHSPELSVFTKPKKTGKKTPKKKKTVASKKRILEKRPQIPQFHIKISTENATDNSNMITDSSASQATSNIASYEANTSINLANQSSEQVMDTPKLKARRQIVMNDSAEAPKLPPYRIPTPCKQIKVIRPVTPSFKTSRFRCITPTPSQKQGIKRPIPITVATGSSTSKKLCIPSAALNRYETKPLYEGFTNFTVSFQGDSGDRKRTTCLSPPFNGRVISATGCKKSGSSVSQNLKGTAKCVKSTHKNFSIASSRNQSAVKAPENVIRSDKVIKIPNVTNQNVIKPVFKRPQARRINDVPENDYQKILNFLKSKVLLKCRASSPSEQMEKATNLANVFIKDNAVQQLDTKTMKTLYQFAEKCIY